MKLAGLSISMDEPPRHYGGELSDWKSRRLVALPECDEAIAIPLSDDLLSNWSFYAERRPPSVSVERVGWDIRRRCGDERGFELYFPLVQAWGDIHDVDAVWASFDRDQSDHDHFILHELAILHNRGQLANLSLVEDGDDTRTEVSDLAQWFNEIRDVAIDEATAHAEYVDRLVGGYFGDVLACEKFAQDVKEGRVPVPANLSIVPSSPPPDLIKSSAEFVEGFVPPEYLVDGVLQRRFCYALTAQTGVGKTTVAMLLAAHVASGRSLGGLDVERGTVLYFAGENPTDVQMRWLGLTLTMDLDPGTTDVHFVPGAMPLSQIAERVTVEVSRKGLQLALVVVDTAAAYFEGDDENSNTQAVDHAKRMRSLSELPGGPTVLILCHPTKRAHDDDLIPRGGGAFLNEVDGNIALRKLDSLVTANALGKFRGPEFSPLSFELITMRDHPKLRDARGRPIPTVVARAVGADDKTRLERSGRIDEDAVLRLLCNAPGGSPTDVARTLNWRLRAVGGKEPAVHHLKAARALKRLEKEKLVEERRGCWFATQKGQKEINAADAAAQSTLNCTPPFPMPMPPRP